MFVAVRSTGLSRFLQDSLRQGHDDAEQTWSTIAEDGRDYPRVFTVRAKHNSALESESSAARYEEFGAFGKVPRFSNSFRPKTVSTMSFTSRMHG